MARLEEALDRLRAGATSSRHKGDLFERMILVALRDHPGVHGQRFKQLWLWKDWPGLKYRKVKKDIGIDIVAEQWDGGLCAIQAKFYDDERISASQVDKFLADRAPNSNSNEWASRIFVATSPYTEEAEEKLRNTPNTTILTKADLDSWLLDWMSLFEKPNKAHYKVKKYQPRADQKEAIKKVYGGLKKQGSRGRLLMPCGTGKSVVSLWIAEKLCQPGDTILYLVPSIALMDQTIQEWSQQRSLKQHILGVCSDRQVGHTKTNNEDNEDILVMELPIPVTTNVDKITQQLQQNHPDALTIVFSTYQSLSNISKAIKQVPNFAFDLVICDEAHRIAYVEPSADAVRDNHGKMDKLDSGAKDDDGDKDNKSGFRLVHDENKLPAQRRLFMTATQRIYKPIVKKGEKYDVYSMDNEKKFGPKLYQMTFRDAIDKGLLTNYEVIAIGISAEVWNSLSDTTDSASTAKSKNWTNDDRVRILGCWDALAHPGVELRLSGNRKAGEVGGGLAHCRQALAFTKTIDKSKHIQTEFGKTLNQFLSKVSVDSSKLLNLEINHIDGRMKAFDRKEKLNWLRDAPTSSKPTARLLSNARCLVEGVDVPTLDAIFFFDPKQSHIEIVQAVGRVMRKAPNKAIGYVILPIIIETDQSIVAPEDIASHSDFKHMFNILNAIRSHDERLDEIMNAKNASKDAPFQIIVGPGLPTTTTPDESTQQALLALRPGIHAIIVDHHGDKRNWPNWGRRTATVYKSIRYDLEKAFKNPVNDGVRQCIQNFTLSMQKTITPTFKDADALDMIVQHLITMPIFEAFFSNTDFARLNPVSIDLNKVINDLEMHNVYLRAYLLDLDDIYKRLPLGLSGDNPVEKLNKLKDMYGGFFKAAVPEIVKKQGVVYTPTEIVDFILRSVDTLLRTEFEDQHGIGSENVNILDPFAGTGTFPARLFTIKNHLNEYLIPDIQVAYKYQFEIKAYELMMLAYYIATLTIEVSASERGIWRNNADYQPFQGISLANTFKSWTENMQNSRRLSLLGANIHMKNSQRVHNQANVPIKVIVGNPPWRAAQKSAGEDNPNTKNIEIATRVRETFGEKQKELGSSGGNAAGNLYIQSLRWAADRLSFKDSNNNMVQNDGIVAFLHPSSLCDAPSLIGARASLRDEFTSIFVVNLRGDTRKNAVTKREGDPIFEASQSGCQITFLVRNTKKLAPAILRYAEVSDCSSRQDKFNWLAKFDIQNDDSFEVVPSGYHRYWPKRGDDSYDKLLTVYDTKKDNTKVIIQIAPMGVKTNCDAYVYSFSRQQLIEKMRRLIGLYEVARQKIHHDNEEITEDVKNKLFEEYTKNNQLSNIKWTDTLKHSLKQDIPLEFDMNRIREVLYRPFTKLWLYEDYHILSAGKAASKLSPPPKGNLLSCRDKQSSNLRLARHNDYRRHVGSRNQSTNSDYRKEVILLTNASNMIFQALATKEMPDLAAIKGSQQTRAAIRYL